MRYRRQARVLILAFSVFARAVPADTPAAAETPVRDVPVAAVAPAATDYADPAHWLCWPGRADNACEADLTTTVIEADGRSRAEPFSATPKPAIDCFYVYPTVSKDPGYIATLAIEAEERFVVRDQFARFAADCRLFAPVYRQVTLIGLRSLLFGIPMAGADDPAVREANYDDVLAAWNYYLTHENHGRGVVLIGHSQGALLLDELIAREIDGKPVQKMLVSAILAGTNLGVPAGADVGGDFKSVPLCRRAGQTGCAIAFESFRADAPPSPDSLFGRPREPQPGIVSACVNPAALSGGGGTLKPYFNAAAKLILSSDASRTVAWSKDFTVTTPFVALPGLLRAECTAAGGANYLAITAVDTPGPRTHEIPGDLVRRGVVLKDWGLHLVDMDLTMGNLLDVVAGQAEAWAKRR